MRESLRWTRTVKQRCTIKSLEGSSRSNLQKENTKGIVSYLVALKKNKKSKQSYFVILINNSENSIYEIQNLKWICDDNTRKQI